MTLPKPSAHAFKARYHLTGDLTPNHNSPIANPPTSTHDPLALPPRPPSPPPDPDRFSYQPPTITTTRLKCQSKPRNLHRITDLVTSNRPQRSSAA